MDLDPEQLKVIAVFIVIAIVTIGAFVIAMRKSAATGERLLMVARDAGWQGAYRTKFLGAIRGVWNGYSAEIRRIPRQKAVPERVVVRLRVQVPARLSVRRRVRGSRPMTFFGPPLVELRDGAGAEFWIRSDEVTLAERLFASAAVTPFLEQNLIGRFDAATLSRDSLQVLRAIDARSQPGAERIVQLATEEWSLATKIVEALALRP
jgi:hypothetical protein